MGKSDAQKSKSNDSELDGMDTLTRVDQTTASNKKKFLAAFKKNRGMVYKSCEAAGIVPQTYYNYLEKDAEFADAIEYLKGLEGDTVESGLIKHLDDPDPFVQLKAQGMYLAAKFRDRGYGTQKTELSGEVNNKVVYVNTPSNSRIPPRA